MSEGQDKRNTRIVLASNYGHQVIGYGRTEVEALTAALSIWVDREGFRAPEKLAWYEGDEAVAKVDVEGGNIFRALSQAELIIDTKLSEE